MGLTSKGYDEGDWKWKDDSWRYQDESFWMKHWGDELINRSPEDWEWCYNRILGYYFIRYRRMDVPLGPITPDTQATDDHMVDATSYMMNSIYGPSPAEPTVDIQQSMLEMINAIPRTQLTATEVREREELHPYMIGSFGPSPIERMPSQAQRDFLGQQLLRHAYARMSSHSQFFQRMLTPTLDQWGDLIQLRNYPAQGYRRWGKEGTLISPGEWELRYDLAMMQKNARRKG